MRGSPKGGTRALYLCAALFLCAAYLRYQLRQQNFQQSPLATSGAVEPRSPAAPAPSSPYTVSSTLQSLERDFSTPDALSARSHWLAASRLPELPAREHFTGPSIHALVTVDSQDAHNATRRLAELGLTVLGGDALDRGRTQLRAVWRTYTVIQMSYRSVMLQNTRQIAGIYLSDPGCARYLLLWNGAKNETPLAGDIAYDERVVVIAPPRNSLSNRYEPSLPVDTDAVVINDDDVAPHDAECIACMHASYIAQPHLLVGVESRRVDMHAGPGHYFDFFPKQDHREPNMVLPEIMFMHRSWMAVYMHERLERARIYVDEQDAHCDDVLLNLAVSSHGAPDGAESAPPHATIGMPYWPGKTSRRFPAHKSGLHNQKERIALRQTCAHDLAKLVGESRADHRVITMAPLVDNQPARQCAALYARLGMKPH